MKTLGPGARGEPVRDVQSRLGALGHRFDPDEFGDFGPGTERAVREFQQDRGLTVDGLIGDDTWEELVEAGRTLGDRVLYLHVPHYRGDDVRGLQARLNILGFDAGREDGIFGERTDRAVREFQRNIGVAPDGIVGADTLTPLTRLRPVGPGPGRATVREAEALRRLSATLDGARVAIDAGHGPGRGELDDRGIRLTGLLAGALVEELRSRGAVPFLLAGADRPVAPAERARAANEAGAELLVSLHLNTRTDPEADGAASYYYGRSDYVSQAGRRLAQLIQGELAIALNLRDGGAHPKSLPILRETRMPAVLVEPCVVSDPAEEAALERDDFRRGLARALADALHRYLDARHEPPG